MYEPKHLPQLNHTTLSLQKLNFGISYSDKFIDPNNYSEADTLHIHNYLEIFFNIESELSFFVNDRVYPVLNGNVVVTKPGEPHVCILNKAQKYIYFCLWVEGDFSSEVFSFLNREDKTPVFSFDVVTLNNLKKHVYYFYEIYKNNGSKLEQMSYLLLILSHFEKREFVSALYSPLPKILQKVLDDIHENISEICQINEIVERSYLSQSTINRYFKKYLNTTPYEYLKSQKLTYAARLLSSGATVMEACMNSGFSDCSLFIIQFKRKFNMTPLKYKKKFFDCPHI